MNITKSKSTKLFDVESMTLQEALVELELEAFVIKDKSLDNELPHGLSRPDTELSCLGAVDPVAN